MRSLSDRMHEAYKLKIYESHIQPTSIQKVLRLFGYTHAINQVYVCCLSKKPRYDIHKYKIANNCFIMCIISDENKQVIDSGSWIVNSLYWDSFDIKILKPLKDNELTNFESIDDLDILIKQNKSSKLIMRYNPT